jgi:hypothetical protein
LEELAEPLITLGKAKGRSEVEKILIEIDEDESGEIEFGEFLEILKGKTVIYGDQKRAEGNEAITEFFKKMINGGIKEVEQSEDDDETSTSFKLILGAMRRQKLLEQIGKKNYNSEFHVPYWKLNQHIKPGNGVNAEYESKYNPHAYN